MTIVVAHNFYQQAGGEDQVFADEVALLRRFGHDVHTFTLHNDAVNGMGAARRLGATVWNRNAAHAIADLVRRTRASVAHFHNTFPLISPAAYHAARDAGAAVVQTLHNFRLICPAAVLFRNGKVCEKCVGRGVAWPGVVHGCYRQSRGTTAAVAATVSLHRAIGTWDRMVDVYIAPSESARAKLLEGGLPADRLVVKPNFVDPDPGVGQGSGGYAIFIGRLSPEKGVETLLDACRHITPAGISLKIAGDGPLSDAVAAAAALNSRIEWLGRRTSAEVLDQIGNARALLVPSQCYETFGRVIVEAFAKGTPVVASRHGAMADLVKHGRTGLLFEPGNSAALAGAVREIMADGERIRLMRAEARAAYELHYTGDLNHEHMMAVYDRAIRSRAPRTMEAFAQQVGAAGTASEAVS